MDVVALKAEHCMELGELAAIHAGFDMTPEIAVDLEEIGGYAAIDGPHVLAVAGVLKQWRGVGLAWCWLDRRWRGHAHEVTAAVINALEAFDMHRIEAAVRCDFEPGHRWAKLLGFEMETLRARKWGPDGKDYTIYVRIK